MSAWGGPPPSLHVRVFTTPGGLLDPPYAKIVVRLRKRKATSRLAATCAAGVQHLERLEEAADSSRRFGPLLTI